MKKSVQEYIEEVEELRKKNANLSNLINEKTMAFEESIAPERERISENTKAIRRLRNVQIRAEVSEIRNQLAKAWNTSPDNISMSMATNLDRTFKNKTLDLYMQEILSFINAQYNFLIIDFSLMSQDQKTVLKKKQIQTPISMGSIQKDGKRFCEHLVPVATPVMGNPELNHYSIVFDNIEDLILDFNLQGAMFVLQENRDNAGKAIIEAMNMYNQKQNEQEMAD